METYSTLRGKGTGRLSSGIAPDRLPCQFGRVKLTVTFPSPIIVVAVVACSLILYLDNISSAANELTICLMQILKVL
jgi:hypothetical protein